MAVSILVPQICMPVKNYQTALSLELSHNLRYTILRRYADEHMNMAVARLCLYNLPPFCWHNFLKIIPMSCLKCKQDRLLFTFSMQVKLCCGMALDAKTVCGTGIQERRQNRIPVSSKRLYQRYERDTTDIGRRGQRLKRGGEITLSRTAG